MIKLNFFYYFKFIKNLSSSMNIWQDDKDNSGNLITVNQNGSLIHSATTILTKTNSFICFKESNLKESTKS